MVARYVPCSQSRYNRGCLSPILIMGFLASQKLSNFFQWVSFFHKVDITEGASAQFSIWIFNFWPYGHYWKKMLCQLWPTFEVLSSFHVQTNVSFKNIVCSIRTKKSHNISFIHKNNSNVFWVFWGVVKLGYPSGFESWV